LVRGGSALSAASSHAAPERGGAHALEDQGVLPKKCCERVQAVQLVTIWAAWILLVSVGEWGGWC